VAAVARGFEVYFGANPALRKEVLVTPVAQLDPATAAALRAARQIPVGRVQLDHDTKLFKNDAICRQIPCVIDGQNPARRKIIAGAALLFRAEGSSREVKIFQLGGHVANKMSYHHGDASLNQSITGMAKAYTGANRYPLLEGIGQFGSRHGDEAGSARYISVREGSIAPLIFPAVDRWFLPYVFEDGARAEPRYFVPVAPLAILESGSNISEGWNHVSFARELGPALAVVNAYIDGDAELHALAEALAAAPDGTPSAALAAELTRLAARWPLPAETAGYAGRVADLRGIPHSFGTYEYDEASRTVTITDLPIGVATGKYMERLAGLTEKGAPPKKAAAKTSVKAPSRAPAKARKAALIDSIRDCSTSDRVRLEVVLAPGAYEALTAAQADPLEEALGLRASLRPHLNYYSPRGGVLELPPGAGYLAAILYWAPHRAALYRARLERALIVAELRAVEERAQLRYAGEAAALDLAARADPAAAEAALAARGYPRLDSALLHRPEYAPNADLRRRVTAGAGATFDYLLDMRARELVRSASAARASRADALDAEAAKVRAQLAEAPVAGASVWRAELAAFRAAAEAMRK
jgi:hypothetical protein